MLRNGLLALENLMALITYDDEVADAGVIVAVAQYLADILSAPEYAFVTYRIPSRHVELYHAHSSLGSSLSNAIVLSWS